MTRSECALFIAIHYGITVEPTELPGRAAHEYHSPTVTLRDTQTALDACLAKGWLQIVDETTLTAIVTELREKRIIGPIYGLPQIGGVDFTAFGAQLWKHFKERCRRDSGEPPFAFTDVVREKSSRFFRTDAAALAASEELKAKYQNVNVTTPIPIGPWRAQWWRRFPSGFRIDIDERMHWQGRASGSATGCFMPYFPKPADPEILKKCLEQNQVTLGEWMLLAAAENGWANSGKSDLPWWVDDFSNANYGVSVSESELQHGLDSCLTHGWLRIVDQQAIDQVCALLQNDIALMPLLETKGICPGNYRYDFSPAGAKLYRRVATEIFGPDWEDNLLVQKGWYWEEHRYCESEKGLNDIVQDIRDGGRVVRVVRTIPIGPWCVYWWERFPAGFRMELDIEEP